MARRFDSHYRMKDGRTRLAEAYFNAIFADLDLRLHSQEEIEKSWQAAIDELNEFGLSRINEFLAPLIEQFQAIASMGFMTATLQGDDAIIFNLGAKTVQINEGAERTYFPTPPFVSLQVGTDADLYAIARCITYDSETGALALEIVSRSAALAADPGPHAGIVVSVLPGGMAGMSALLDEALGHRLASELSAATAAINAAAAGATIAAVEDMRDDTEAARDAVLAILPGGEIPLTRQAASADLAIPTALTTIDVSALGAAPKLVSFQLVCQTGELGYTAGDIVPVSASAVGGTSDTGNQPFLALAMTANSIKLNPAASSGLRIVRMDTGAQAAITYANWRLRVLVWG